MMKRPKWIGGAGLSSSESEEEEQGPEIVDDDYIIQDNEHRRGYGVFVSGKKIFQHERLAVLFRAIRLRMTKERYYPNIWYVNERGNIDLLDDKGNILKSWV